MLAALLSLVTPCALPQGEPATALTRADLPAWRAHLAPRPAEVAWRQIPWHQSMGAGLREAADLGRPMLLWLMNGHPLGCT
ncbi:MAG: hypothetical protein VYD05_08335 [Planctomycetota bacterium]|nr:hypothetical protein [Planctomycetota bacterium]MEC8251989.1 hypothetical protein [Planctomycetota bacterium]MEC8653038.1 hypothetical protein [Planctomycetota bacterium]MEC9046715.1 hypothetical protein [Planctomycetota bacterium]